MKQKIEKLQPRGLTDLMLYANKAWESIDDNTIRACITGLRRQMKRIIEANGDNVFISKPKRFKRINYAEKDFNEEPKKCDPNYYNKCAEKKIIRKTIKKLKEIKEEIIDNEKDKDSECDNESIDNLANKAKKIALKAYKKYGYEDEDFLGKKRDKE